MSDDNQRVRPEKSKEEIEADEAQRRFKERLEKLNERTRKVDKLLESLNEDESKDKKPES